MYMTKFCNSKSWVMHNLCKLYIKDDTDILGFKASQENYITYHHIIHVEDLDLLGFPTKKTIENGIALTRHAHSYLHLIEDFAPDIFNQINKIILLITKERRYPNPDEIELIQICLECFEYRMFEYYQIKPEFLKRSRILVS